MPVLVTDADTMAAIGVIRSLGRAGYDVHACSSDAAALGLRSRFCRRAAVCPPARDDNFLHWMRHYVGEKRIRVLIPSERVLLALRTAFDEFRPLLPTSDNSDIVYSGLSKFDLFRNCRRDAHIPPTLLVENTAEIPGTDDLAALGTPLYLKADGAYARDGQRSATERLDGPAACRDRMLALARSFHKLLIQGHVPGQGVGVFLLRWRGRIIAEFMHRRLHEVPHTGGVSSLRESWWHQRIRDDAVARLDRLGWEGVAMMEYRWDPAQDRFWLMEMNGRFWGSLHLAMYCGVDFPRMLVDAFCGAEPGEPPAYPLGLRCRHTFPRDVQYVRSRWKDRNVPLRSRLADVAEFVTLFLDPRVRGDLWFPGDRGLYWSGVWNFLRTMRHR